jgi:glycosyltransferase involved in cell wall biosynthesis
MLLEAAAQAVRDGRVVLDIVGDGPEREALGSLAGRLGISRGLTFHGWVPHERLHAITGKAHVLGFPSIREFGGAVVLEAMLMGMVPLVVAYGGPGELITPSTGIGVPIGSRREIIEAFRAHLDRLAADPAVLAPMAVAGRAMVLRDFTWEAKARAVLEVYRWVLGRRANSPSFAPGDAAEGFNSGGGTSDKSALIP